MKFLTPVVLLIMSLQAAAQWLPPLDPSRQAERDAVYGPNRPAPLTPGNSPYHPGHGGRRPMPPRPPVRPTPPPPPHYGHGAFGPQYTVRWDDRGAIRLPKFISESTTIYVGGRLVNEILVRSINNHIEIESATAYLTNGQVIDLRNIIGTLREGREIRTLVDAYYSLRIERIDIHASSPNLIGSRGQMQLILGLAE